MNIFLYFRLGNKFLIIFFKDVISVANSSLEEIIMHKIYGPIDQKIHMEYEPFFGLNPSVSFISTVNNSLNKF